MAHGFEWPDGVQLALDRRTTERIHKAATQSLSKAGFPQETGSNRSPHQVMFHRCEAGNVTHENKTAKCLDVVETSNKLDQQGEKIAVNTEAADQKILASVRTAVQAAISDKQRGCQDPAFTSALSATLNPPAQNNPRLSEICPHSAGPGMIFRCYPALASCSQRLKQI